MGLLRFCLLLPSVSTTLYIANASAAGASFTPVGLLPGGFKAWAASISPDGSTVSGSCTVANATEFYQQGYRWRADGSLIGLGRLNSSPYKSSSVWSMSDNGEVIVGTADSTTVPYTEAFRWTSPTGMRAIAHLPISQNDSSAQCISGDGKVIVGSATYLGTKYPVRWTNDGATLEIITDLFPTNATSPFVRATNYDGSAVVGSASTGAYWKRSGSPAVALGDLPGGDVLTNIYGMDATGNVVLGASRSSNGLEAFRWTAQGGMIPLGDLPGGGFQSIAYGCTPNASVVVGRGTTANGDTAFVYDSVNGMRSIRDILVGAGINLTGWRLVDAIDVSDDGQVIVGSAIDPQLGDYIGYVAVLPEPTIAAMVLLPVIIFGRRRRHDQRRSA